MRRRVGFRTAARGRYGRTRKKFYLGIDSKPVLYYIYDRIGLIAVILMGAEGCSGARIVSAAL